MPNTLQLSHDFGGVDRLRYVTEGGEGVDGAAVFVYSRAKYARDGHAATAGPLTKTGADGRWLHPVELPANVPYIVVFEKFGSYGPDTVTVDDTFLRVTPTP